MKPLKQSQSDSIILQLEKPQKQKQTWPVCIHPNCHFRYDFYTEQKTVINKLGFQNVALLTTSQPEMTHINNTPHLNTRQQHVF